MAFPPKDKDKKKKAAPAPAKKGSKKVAPKKFPPFMNPKGSSY